MHDMYKCVEIQKSCRGWNALFTYYRYMNFKSLAMKYVFSFIYILQELLLFYIFPLQIRTHFADTRYFTCNAIYAYLAGSPVNTIGLVF